MLGCDVLGIRTLRSGFESPQDPWQDPAPLHSSVILVCKLGIILPCAMWGLGGLIHLQIALAEMHPRKGRHFPLNCHLLKGAPTVLWLRPVAVGESG